MIGKNPTLIGHVDSVNGGVVTVCLLDHMPTLVMVAGQSYRIGQIGAFVRIPLGYTQLYAVCTLVGAAAAPQKDPLEPNHGHRWISVTLFGESVGDSFERCVSQYPTIQDEVHIVTPDDVKIIYGSTLQDKAITVGHIAASSGIEGRLDLAKLVARHSAIVGSTGAGKSNFVAVLLEALATQGLKASRVLVIDPHGEYASSIGKYGYTFRVNPDISKGEKPLHVPFWALPFDELRDIAFGEMQPASDSAIRDEIKERKKSTALTLTPKPPETAITSDSPISFNIRKLWFDFDDFERQTFNQNQGRDLCTPTTIGDSEKLISNIYPKPALGSSAPFANPTPRRLMKQLELLKSRLQDTRFNFLFNPGPDYTPDVAGKTLKDLDTLVQTWIGHDKPITVLDVSGMPSEILSTVVGTMLRIVYDMLFWAADLSVGGRKQPLLIVLEEAHIFLPEGKDSPAHRTVTKIAKEGRKYGAGLCIVTQRPTEVESTVLSQCGTIIALRVTNPRDRERVASTMPDDLGALAGMLPSLRTGEGLVIGEAMPIPSRIQFYRANNKPIGGDPDVLAAWMAVRPDGSDYKKALENWRRQSIFNTGETNNG
ncbi:MAG: ATP-binding protein [Candidatus Omnitrophica bacterium]|nr:ATP-binding protein [Candidatus Omnitrophota bacterium]